jgi:hypothetical protein
MVEESSHVARNSVGQTKEIGQVKVEKLMAFGEQKKRMDVDGFTVNGLSIGVWNKAFGHFEENACTGQTMIRYL